MNEQQVSGIKINYWFLVGIFAAMFISGAIVITFFIRTNSLANKKIAEATEANRPANLEIITISDNSCKDCFDINPVLNYIQKENVKINSEKNVDKASEEGKELIKQFAIQKLPTFILKGELNKVAALADVFSKTGDISNDTFVFRQVGAPYSLAETGEVKGRIGLTLLTDITCTECYDVTQHETILKNNFGINTTPNVLDSKSAAGRALLNKYKITLVPTFILTGDTGEYPSLKQAWADVGTIAKDGTYIFTNLPLMGTYKNLSTNKVIVPPAPTQTQS